MKIVESSEMVNAIDYIDQQRQTTRVKDLHISRREHVDCPGYYHRRYGGTHPFSTVDCKQPNSTVPARRIENQRKRKLYSSLLILAFL